MQEDVEEVALFFANLPELVNGAAELLDRATVTIGIARFSTGAPLPGGLPRELIRHLYSEAATDPFRINPKRVDLSDGPWDGLGGDEKRLALLERCLTAYCQALAAGKADQHNAIRIDDGLLGPTAVAASEGFGVGFRKSRAAYLRAYRTFRSKSKLSQVLEWLIDQYYTPERLQGIAMDGRHDHQADERIVSHILEGTGGVAPPVVRPSVSEQKALLADLMNGSRDLLSVLLAAPADFAKRLSALPAPLASLAKALRADPQQAAALDEIAKTSRGAAGPVLFDGLTATVQVLLADFLLPEVFRSTTTSRPVLEAIYRANTSVAYVVSLLIGGRGEDAMRQVALDLRPSVEGHIDRKTLKIVGKDLLVKTVLDSLFQKVLLAPAARELMTTGLAELDESLTFRTTEDGLRELPPIKVHHWTTDDQRDSADRTHDHPDRLKLVVGEKALTLVEKAFAPAPSAKAGDPGQGKLAPVAGTGLLQSRLAKDLAAKPPEPPRGGVSDEWMKQEAIALADRVLEDEHFRVALQDRIEAAGKTSWLIFDRFGRNRTKVALRDAVRKMTALGIMLGLPDDELGLGVEGSNLVQLVIDLLPVDVDRPAATFIETVSLLNYFEEHQLADGGLTALRKLLRWQGRESLRNTAELATHLRSAKHVFDALGRAGGEFEIQVLTATADGFKDWLEHDNLATSTGDDGLPPSLGRLRLGQLVDEGDSADSVAPPALALMTDLSFHGCSKAAWLRSFAGLKLLDEETGLAYACPPLCLGATATDRHALLAEASELGGLLDALPAHGIVVGPSLPLNPPSSAFPTRLSAGSMFAVSLMAPELEQGLVKSVPGAVRGPSFEVFTTGGRSLSASMEKLIWGAPRVSSEGEPARTGVAFAAQAYLYIIELLLGTASYSGDRATPDPAEFYPRLLLNDGVKHTAPFKSSRVLDRLVCGGKALRFALEQDPSVEPLLSVRVGWDDEDLLFAPDARWFRFDAVNPFNRVRALLRRPDRSLGGGPLGPHPSPHTLNPRKAAMNTLTFHSPSIELSMTDVTGRSMNLAWENGLGFQNRAQIRVLQRHNAATKLCDVSLNAAGLSTRGTLTISGDDVSQYSFHDIDLQEVRTRISRRERVRVCEWVMKSEVTDHQPKYRPPGFSSPAQEALKGCDLGDDYRFALGGSMENLLAFESFVSTNDATVFRFVSAKADPENCWVSRLLAVHKDWYDSQSMFKPFKVEFSGLKARSRSPPAICWRSRSARRSETSTENHSRPPKPTPAGTARPPSPTTTTRPWPLGRSGRPWPTTRTRTSRG